MVIGTTFVLLILSSAILEVLRLQIIAHKTRDAVQAAVTETCESNYAGIYDGVREGYSGGYTLDGNEWVQNISAGDVYGRVDDQLGTQQQGDLGIKLSEGKEVYKLSGLNAQMTNAPFAPNDPDNENKLTCTAGVDLEVPLYLGWQGIPPMRVHIPIKSGYTPKF